MLAVPVALCAALAYADRLQELFPNRLYIELARRNDPVEDAAEAALIELAYARDLPLVATNPACSGSECQTCPNPSAWNLFFELG